VSLEVRVRVEVVHFDRRVITIDRTEGVLPVNLFDPTHAAVTDSDVELFDLARAALSRLIGEVAQKADAQAGDVRALLLRMIEREAGA
jgi:hypothetical protein